MTLNTSAPRAKQRWLTLGLAVTAMMVLIASAVLGNIGASTFEGGDGNLIHSGTNTDWDNVTGLNKGIDVASGSGDNSFGQGTNEDDPNVVTVAGSIPPNKNDLTRFYEASELIGTDTYLYLGWERAVNIGNANLDFEINQATTANLGVPGPHTIVRTAGDLLVNYDFGGSGTPTLSLNTWLTAGHSDSANDCYKAHGLPCWGKHVTLSGTNSEGAVNTGNVTDPIAPNAPRTLGTGLFGEAAINLTGAGVIPAGTCEAFGSAFLKSRSSSSFTAEIKDFIAPIAVNINTCGGITIHKVTENGDATFGYTTTGGLTPSTFNLSNGGTQTYSSVASGSSSVTETALAGWTLKSLTCTASGAGTSYSISGATVNITMAGGGSVDCTYTNHTDLQPTLVTDLSADSILNTATVTDTATLSGATANATGAITISRYSGSGSDACVAANLLESKTATPTTNGNGDYTATFGPMAAGHYEFQAVYAGDGNNLTATSVCGTEPLIVKNAPSATTAQNLIPNDTLTLIGATADAGGDVDFYLFSPSQTCSVANKDTAAFKFENIGLTTNDHASTSNSTAVTAVGTWHWLAIYSGDDKNNGVTSLCTETFNITN
jgi:hypothetical protein